MTKSPRIINADVIRVTAMFMVILLHTILNFTIRTDFFATKLWFLFEPIIAISKTCVLLFFMLSGYLVISKKRSLKENLEKTFKKILIPLTFFTLLNIAYAWTKFHFNGNNLDLFIIDQTKRMVSFPSSPMWFLVVLTFLYLLNPIWQMIFSKEQKPELARLITGGSLAFSLLATVAQFPAQRVYTMFNSFTAWTAFAFFYFYGALVKNKWIKVDNQRMNLIVVGIGLILTIIGDFLNIWQRINQVSFIWNDYTGNYLSIPIVMIAVGIFNLLISADFSELKSNILTWLSGLSFGIYLIHTYVISLFTDIIGFDFNKLSINVYLYNFLNVFLVLSISILLTSLIKRVPKFKAIIGE